MVLCKHCSTPNSLDSTFCRHCGTALPEADVLLAQEKLTALIAEGNTSFNEGKTDEAMAVAESALLSNPSSVAALSLMALCFERRGQLAEALECADKIVDLNPDSELDKIKRNQLRSKLSVSVQLATQPPDRRSAVIGAAAAVVLFVCIGIGLARLVNRGDAAKGTNAIADRQTPPIVTPQQPLQPLQSQQTTSANTNRQSYQPTGSQTNAGSGDGNLPAQIQRDLNAGSSGGSLPGTDPNGQPLVLSGDIDGVATPPTPKTNTSTVKKPTPTQSNGAESTGDDPSPTVDKASGAGAQDTSPGTIEIQVSTGSRRPAFNAGGVDVGSSPGGVDSEMRMARQKFELGAYSGAATLFEQALRTGSDPVSTNQWLGRCYGNLNRKSDQVDAYKRCLAACEAALSKGGGNKDKVRATMDTCQQELRVLQGN